MDTLDDFDLILDRVGGFGQYQRLISLLLLAPIGMTGAFSLANVFNAAQPDFSCRIEHCDHADLDSNPSLPFTIPKDESGNYDFCRRFDRVTNTSTCFDFDFSPDKLVDCEQFVFSKEHYGSSVVTEFELVCDDAWQVPMAQTLFFVTTIFTPPIMGQLATWVGRKPTLILSLILMSISTLALPLVPNLQAFLAMQVPIALGQCGVFQTGLVLLLELVDRRRLVFGSIAPQVAFTLGVFYLTVSAYLLRDWRRIQLTLGIPTVLFVLYSPFLPESPRWLFRNGKGERAKAVLSTMAKVNKKEQHVLHLVNNLKTDNNNNNNKEGNEKGAGDIEEVVVKESLLDVFRWPVLTLRTFILFYVWLVISMAYYGLSLNTDSLAGDPYVNFALTAMVEIPGYALSILALDRVGRKVCVGGSLLLSSLFIVLSILELAPSLKLTVYLLGKTMITCAFGSIFLLTSELYPTSIRAIGVGSSNAMARIGSTLAPQVGLTAAILPVLPILLFGAAALTGGLAVVLGLPETKGRSLPETLAQAAAIGRSKATKHNFTANNADTDTKE